MKRHKDGSVTFTKEEFEEMNRRLDHISKRMGNLIDTMSQKLKEVEKWQKNKDQDKN